VLYDKTKANHGEQIQLIETASVQGGMPPTMCAASFFFIDM
jgi:hypothetical protein